mgnify:CR=1 FL=1
MALGHWAVEYLGEGNGQGGSGGGGVLVVHESTWTEDTITYFQLDKTWQEIYDALLSGVLVNIVEFNNVAEGVTVISSLIMEAEHFNNTYRVRLRNLSNSIVDYTVDDPDGYPFYTQGGK